MVTVEPITGADRAAVADFLHRHLNPRVPPAAWQRAMRTSWAPDAGDHGYLLRDGGAVVGAYLAFYSERTIAGRRERFCNLGAWCVLPAYRRHAPRLLRALLSRRDTHFTDLSPSGSVVEINRRLGFRFLDTTTVLVPARPRLAPGAVTDRPDEVVAALDDRQRRLFRDHADAPAVHHVLLRRGDRTCYVMARRERRRGLPLFASVLHVSDPEVFRRMAGALGGHLLRRHGVAALLVEPRIAGCRPLGALPWPRPRPKMYRSERLTPDQIDDLYSELVCLPW